MRPLGSSRRTKSARGSVCFRVSRHVSIDLRAEALRIGARVFAHVGEEQLVESGSLGAVGAGCWIRSRRPIRARESMFGLFPSLVHLPRNAEAKKIPRIVRPSCGSAQRWLPGRCSRSLLEHVKPGVRDQHTPTGASAQWLGSDERSEVEPSSRRDEDVRTLC